MSMRCSRIACLVQVVDQYTPQHPQAQAPGDVSTPVGVVRVLHHRYIMFKTFNDEVTERVSHEIYRILPWFKENPSRIVLSFAGDYSQHNGAYQVDRILPRQAPMALCQDRR